MKKRLGLVYKK